MGGGWPDGELSVHPSPRSYPGLGTCGGLTDGRTAALTLPRPGSLLWGPICSHKIAFLKRGALPCTSQGPLPTVKATEAPCLCVFCSRSMLVQYVASEGQGSLACCNLCMRANSLPSCLTLCNTMDRSPSGSSVHGILQARILE